jgi:hypothetical protein
MVPSYIFWTLWQERNNHTFKNTERTGYQLHELFSNILYDWATVWRYSNSKSVIFFFIDSLQLTSLASPL